MPDSQGNLNAVLNTSVTSHLLETSINPGKTVASLVNEGMGVQGILNDCIFFDGTRWRLRIIYS